MTKVLITNIKGPQGNDGAPAIPGLHTPTVSGAVMVPVEHEHAYEVTATATATVSLDGVLGCQAAITWSGSAGTLEGTATADGQTYVAIRLTAGWKIFTVGGAGDTTAPTPGTLGSSAITSSGFTLTVTGASDAGAGLHATPYRFSTDNGATWSAYLSSAVFVVTGKTAATVYTCKHQVQDAAGNVATGSSLGVTTASGGDVTPPTPGTVAGSAISSSGFTLTISGASDAGGLHAQPYAFSTDNGVTWSAYQAGASLAITGKAASTGYQCKGRVRDAAGNTADTPAQTVTTASAVLYSTEVLADSPTHYWPLDDAAGSSTARDLGSSSSTPTVQNVTFGVAGIGDGATCAQFAGTANSWIRTGVTQFSGATTATIEGIFLRSTGGRTDRPMAANGSDWLIQVGADNKPAVVLKETVFGSAAISLGQAFHLAVVRDGATTTLYLNGVSVGSAAASGAIGTIGGQTTIGNGDGSSGATWDGKASGVATYGTALSAARILAHARAAGLA